MSPRETVAAKIAAATRIFTFSLFTRMEFSR
jgi:hypothetical protein